VKGGVENAGEQVSQDQVKPPGFGRGVLSIPDDAALERWSSVPPEERLRSLAEANEFLCLAQPNAD